MAKSKRYRVNGAMTSSISIRRDRDKPFSEENRITWLAGEIFTPPAHLKSIGGLTLAEAIRRGVIEEVRDDG